MTIFAPFNHHPFSTTLRGTGAYVVPAGFYARVIPFNPTFTIGGSEIFNSFTVAESGINDVGASAFNKVCRGGMNFSMVSFVISSSSAATVNVVHSVINPTTGALTDVTIATQTNVSDNGIFRYYPVPSTGSIRLSGGGGTGNNLSYVASYFTPAHGDFWVVAGTSLNVGTGSYLVELYAIN